MLEKYPTFLVIGVQKGGPGWLYTMIRQHPEITVGDPKELQFFDKAYYYEKGIDWYKSHFEVSTSTKAVGELTPGYFWTSSDADEIEESGRNKDVPKLVSENYPDIKLIVSLRDPVDRAVSAYFHHIRSGRISPNQNILSVMNNFGIKTMGYYDIHLRKWYEYFQKNRLLVLIYESHLTDSNKAETLRRIFQHIDVDDSFRPENLKGRINIRMSHFELRLLRLPKNLRKIICRGTPNLVKNNNRWDIEISEEARNTLREIYKPHNEKLEDLLGFKLPWG